MKAYIILGIDPGTTLAAAFLNYETGDYTLFEARGARLTDVLRASLHKGIIIAIATDKAKPPGMARKLKAITQSILITPSKDLTLEEKARLLNGREKGRSQHVKDALAAALYAHAWLKQREEKERKRLAHAQQAFTPALFFKTPRRERTPQSKTRKHAIAQHSPTPNTARADHTTHFRERIAQLEHALAEAEARAAYYAHLAERLLKEHAKPQSMDLDLLKRIKPHGIKLPSNIILGKKGTPIRLPDLGITLYIADDAAHHTPPRKKRRERRATRESHEQKETDPYELLTRIITDHRNKRTQNEETRE